MDMHASRDIAPVEQELAVLREQLDSDGYTIIRGAADRALISAIAMELSPIFAATPFCAGDFYGPRTKRVGRLLTRSTLVRDLIMNRLVGNLAQATLGDWCDTLQLNLAQAIEIHRGALLQFPHRDQAMWGGEIGRMEYLINVIWPLTPFRGDTGATIIWPHSHGIAAMSGTPPEMNAVDAVADPGDAIVFLGSTLHGAGSNRTPVPRQAVVISYCLGWLKPYENPWLSYPPAIARHFPPELADLIGYRQHRPNLGNVDGQCPSLLLRGPLPEHVGAIDALTPDQAIELAAFVARQSSGPAAP
jgi:ectoine hydroxylase-related dioxygenase (phytanoyl-CoA dioxygenase family)